MNLDKLSKAELKEMIIHLSNDKGIAQTANKALLAINRKLHKKNKRITKLRNETYEQSVINYNRCNYLEEEIDKQSKKLSDLNFGYETSLKLNDELLLRVEKEKENKEVAQDLAIKRYHEIEQLKAKNEKLNEYNDLAFWNSLDFRGSIIGLNKKVENLDVSIDNFCEIIDDQNETIKHLRIDLKKAKDGFDGLLFFSQKKTKRIAELVARIGVLAKENSISRELINSKNGIIKTINQHLELNKVTIKYHKIGESFHKSKVKELSQIIDNRDSTISSKNDKLIKANEQIEQLKGQIK